MGSGHRGGCGSPDPAGDASFAAVGETTNRKPSVRMKLRIATLEDVGAIAARVQSAYRGEASRRGWTTEADLLDGQRTDPQAVAELIARDRSVILLAEDEGGRLLACIHVEGEGAIARFGMFAVAPARQAAGVGRSVLQAAEAHASGAWNASEMRLLVIAARSELIAWYERRDYRPTGATAPFPYGDARFGLPRRDDLGFIEMAKPLSMQA